jgi:hypothetical protein
MTRTVPCKASVEHIGDLVTEAEHLWAAECNRLRSRALGADWGCCGAFIRPELINLVESWGKVFQERVIREVFPVGKHGELRVLWPLTLNGEKTDLDIILATATKAELTSPTLEEIARAWVKQSVGHEQYFFENV